MAISPTSQIWEKKNIAFEILNQYYDWQKEIMYKPASLFIWTIQITDV
jgi:hypothetical protein